MHCGKEWYYCTCGKKLLKYNTNAMSKGIYIKCKKCDKEIEIVVNRADEPRHSKE